MPKGKTLSAKQAAVEVLREAGEPLPMKELAARVLKKNVRLKGKTPEATIAATVVVAANKGQLFTKTDRGVYGLRPDADEPLASELKEQAGKAKDDHDPRGDVPGTVVVRKGGDVKPDPKPKPTRKRGTRAKASA